MNITKAKTAGFPQEGSLITTYLSADVRYEQDFHDNTVRLNIDDYWFKRQDLKELRKFLKLLINEMNT